ncbi:hypothetical protein [Streptomyces sp. NPDC001594]|uniref:hypothetical protein n=1 Tax=Streptomyces sp. NPDC001594 TaxID=3364590 RepID=UPI0036BF8797
MPIGPEGTVTTDPVTTGFPDGPARGGGCGPHPVLELASSPRIVEKHAFLLAGRGGLLPVHLTYTPPAEGSDAPPARRPREATGPAALTRWAQEACALDAVDGRAVRAVNLWDFAVTELPETPGRAVWSCTRATHWTGQGDGRIRIRPPAGALPGRYPGPLHGRLRPLRAARPRHDDLAGPVRPRLPTGRRQPGGRADRRHRLPAHPHPRTHPRRPGAPGPRD